ncbi:MAG: hypothetical protein CL916_02330, partial [Deltaproteobacteria bacterium]|nr:hypothetical protein [Deltaproteobacteria bacterium]
PCWLFPKEDGSYTWAELQVYLEQRTDSSDWEILKQQFIQKATPEEYAFLRRHYEGTSLYDEVIAFLNQHTSTQV